MRKEDRFVCEFCGTAFTEESRAHQCEETHAKVDSVVETCYAMCNEIPSGIVIAFTNGYHMHYVRQGSPWRASDVESNL